MARGVEVHPHVVPGLELRDRRAGGDRVRAGRIQVVHLDVEDPSL